MNEWVTQQKADAKRTATTKKVAVKHPDRREAQGCGREQSPAQYALGAVGRKLLRPTYTSIDQTTSVPGWLPM